MSGKASDGLLVATLAATRSAEALWDLARLIARAATIKELEEFEEEKEEGR